MFLKLMELDRLFFDALLTDKTGKLLFLSAWGRDTAIQELVAKMSLPSEQQGFLGSALLFTGEREVRVSLSRDDKFEKRQGRVSGGVFGDSLVNVWIYAPICVWPDTANSRAVFLTRDTDEDDRDERLWSIIKTISAAPVLDEWRSGIIDAFRGQGWIAQLTGMGVTGFDINLKDAASLIGELVRSGVLRAEGSSNNQEGIAA